MTTRTEFELCRYDTTNQCFFVLGYAKSEEEAMKWAEENRATYRNRVKGFRFTFDEEGTKILELKKLIQEVGMARNRSYNVAEESLFIEIERHLEGYLGVLLLDDKKIICKVPGGCEENLKIT